MDLQFNQPKDQTELTFFGSKENYTFTRGQLKSLNAKLSEAYAKAKGDRDAMNVKFDEFVAGMNMTDRVAINNLQAISTDSVEKLYVADPRIISASPTTSKGFYMLRHRELVRQWHEEAMS